MKSDLDEMRNGVEALIINVRHAACTQCKVADETFAKVAKQIAKAKSDSWKRKIRLALVDARMERPLARYLGASCAKVPPDCRHFVFGPLGEGRNEPLRIRGRHDEAVLLADLRPLSHEQLRPISAAEARQRHKNASRGLAVLAPGALANVVRIALRMRLRMDIAVAKTTPDATELGLIGDAKGAASSIVICWPPFEAEASTFDGPAEALELWLRARSVPLLG